MRFQPGASPASLKSWIIQSDYLGDEGTSPFINPNAEKLEKTKLGKAEELTPTWIDPNPDHLFLQAVGPGNVTFSAYAPGIENVFSFVDTQVATLPNNSLLTYLVVGWYSKPGEDPLAGITSDTWKDRLSELKWQTNQVPTAASPQQSLFHGMLHSITWQTEIIPQRPNSDPKSISEQVKVAIGNTAIDALAALVQTQAQKEGQTIDTVLLEAFQYGLLESLDKPDGVARVSNQIRQAWYGSSNGGTFWQIVPAPHQTSQYSPDPRPYAEALATLNSQQNQLDENVRQLASLQEELYKRWWKAGKLYNTSPPYSPQYPPGDFSQIQDNLKIGSPVFNSFRQSVEQKQQQVNQLASSLPNPQDPTSIASYAKNILKLPDTFILKPTAMPRFWHPNDPVVLISGLDTSFPQSDDDLLLCRLPGQTVTGLMIDGKSVDATTAGLQKNILYPVNNSYVPNGQIAALCNEVFFLDPNNALVIARDGLQDQSKEALVQQAITNHQWASSQSVCPDSLAYGSWVQAWRPLFLEWDVDWYPTYTQNSVNDPWVFGLDQWQFDGEQYRWIGQQQPSNDLIQAFSGRTFLTPQAVFNFQARLENYLKNHPNLDLSNIDKLLQDLQDWDILSQRLSGFYDQLSMHKIEQNWPPDASIASQVGDQHHAIPNPEQGDVDTSFGGAAPFFFPQKAGFFMFKKLQVVDCFGQVTNLIYANGNIGGNYQAFLPIRSSYLIPDQPGELTSPNQFIQQRLGPIQTSRLNFRWVDSTNDEEEVGLAANANPICGWLLPNHIDNSVMVYDGQGHLLGEVLVEGGTQNVNWTSVPDSPNPLIDPSKIPNIRLRGLIQGIVGTNKANAFKNFFQVIDETLWFVNPLGGRDDQKLSVLIGRPLALVRAKLQFVWDGESTYNQSWETTFKQDDGGISTISFDIRLGSLELRDDGLVGYYLDSDNYTVFNAVHYPSGLTPANPPYIKPIGGDTRNYISLKFDGNKMCCTLLMDPRGSVYAHTGILPDKSITLPSSLVELALKSMEVSFRVGPLLTDSDAIRIPKLSEQNGQWCWIQHSNSSTWTVQPLTKASALARLPDAPPRFLEGWLRLKNFNTKGKIR
ncbi:hypothetical protein [Candidatus Odyssella acanthamoebae]|uniref:hypothetical protein n=1 Tax=Candidatus Odyssella acanthamoebae TaxID=91604 RepID=UPI0005715008|nr:hypothetical protein [Candidatus Paracaedibacter acanthamoebae]